MTAFETIPFLGDFIGGQFAKPLQANGSIEKRDPGDTKQIVLDASFEYEHVNAAREPARRAFRPWADLSLDDRKNHILRLREEYVNHADELATVISRVTGKAFWESK